MIVPKKEEEHVALPNHPTRRDLGRGALAAILAAPALALPIRRAAAAENIKFGFNGDLSASPSAQSGRAAVVGIQAAIDDQNRSGGVLSRQLALVARDDLSQPPKSIQNMSDLIDNEKVAAVFGPTNSGNALAWKHIPNQKHVPVMGSIGSATDITKPTGANADNYMFRVGSVDRTQVLALTAYAKKDPATHKIGFLTETTGYGQGGLKDLQDAAKVQGLTAAASEKFNVSDTDMTSQLGKLRSAGVDTVLVWAQGTPMGQLMRSMDKIGYFPRVLASWAADNLSFFDAAGPTLAEKPIFLRTISEDRSPRQQQFYDRVRPKLDADSAFSFAVMGYDAAMLMAKAIQQAGSTDGPAVRAALEDLQGSYEGIAKTYQRPFSRTDHEALKAEDMHWTHWKDGKLAVYSDGVVASLRPEDFKS